MAADLDKLFEYMGLLGKLKQTQRTGWILRGVQSPESVSDHMYRMAMTAFLAPPPLDSDKCVKMALVHDMAECIVGDLTPYDNVPKAEKFRREEKATLHMCSLVGDAVGSKLLMLWREYEEQKSPEAKFVKDLDRLDMVLQAFEYEKRDMKPGFLQEFFDSTEGKFMSPWSQSMRKHLESMRAKHRALVVADTLSPMPSHSIDLGQEYDPVGATPVDLGGTRKDFPKLKNRPGIEDVDTEMTRSDYNDM